MKLPLAPPATITSHQLRAYTAEQCSGAPHAKSQAYRGRVLAALAQLTCTSASPPPARARGSITLGCPHSLSRSPWRTIMLHCRGGSCHSLRDRRRAPRRSTSSTAGTCHSAGACGRCCCCCCCCCCSHSCYRPGDGASWQRATHRPCSVRSLFSSMPVRQRCCCTLHHSLQLRAALQGVVRGGVALGAAVMGAGAVGAASPPPAVPVAVLEVVRPLSKWIRVQSPQQARPQRAPP